MSQRLSPSRFRLVLSAALLGVVVPALAAPTATLTVSPGRVNENVNFTLIGTAKVSEKKEIITNYRYEELSPTPAILYDGVPKATYGPIKAPLVGPSGTIITYRLTVTSLTEEGVTGSDSSILAVVVNNTLVAPVANAGLNFAVGTSKSAQLNGSGTDANGTIASYLWTQIAGTAVVLSDPAAPNPTFTSPAVAGPLTFRLAVTDNDGQTGTDGVVVTVQANSPPVVNAGPLSRTVNEGTLVTLNGTVTDANNDPLTYSWVQVSGPQTIAIVNASSVDATFTAPAVAVQETYVFRLTASDGVVPVSDSITILVNNLNVNLPPVASAGPNQGVVEGVTVNLSAAGSSDPNGDPLSFAWTQTGGPVIVSLTGAGTASPSFLAPQVSAAGAVLTFRVTVSDGRGGSATSSVSVTIQDAASPNRPPTVNAGPDQVVGPGADVTLVGAASDPESAALTYKWTPVSGPREVPLTGAETASASFSAPNAQEDETYVFQLTASDGVLTGFDRVTVLVKASSPAAASGLPLISNSRVFPSPFSPAAGGATIRYTLRSASDVTVLISDIFGRQVRELRANAGSGGGTSGDNDLAWDGRNGEGDSLANGAYVVQITARDPSGAQGKISDRVGVRR